MQRSGAETQERYFTKNKKHDKILIVTKMLQNDYDRCGLYHLCRMGGRTEIEMSHITRYGKRMKLMLLTAMTVACFICLFAIPFAEKKLLNNEVGYYSVRINDIEIGKANSRTEAGQALAAARKRLSQEYTQVVYMNPKYEVLKESSLIAERMTTSELEDAIYSALFSCMLDMEKQLAYTVRIDDYTVTLGSSKEVVELMEMVTAQYDTGKEFQVSLESSGSEGDYTVQVVKSQLTNTDVDIVAAALNGDAAMTKEDGTVVYDGVTEISFEQEVTVSTTLADRASVVGVNEAFEAITKEQDENIVYYVQSGDTLSGIAQKYSLELDEIYELNPSVSEDSVIVPGDEIIITVPRSEITVITTKRETYEEDYQAQPQYVDDDTAYRGTNTVVSEGTTGHRKVTAEVTYVNGRQLEVQAVEETIITESQPQVISVGTLTPPDYLKPVTGTFSSGYGERNGSFHKGVDWLAPQGTAVHAAAEGKVTRAGWYSNYGYCVDIVHADGMITRYAHLDSISVSVGQAVSQGQLIAYSGNTGDSSAPHLHFEMWNHGSTVNPLNYVNRN